MVSFLLNDVTTSRSKYWSPCSRHLLISPVAGESHLCFSHRTTCDIPATSNFTISLAMIHSYESRVFAPFWLRHLLRHRLHFNMNVLHVESWLFISSRSAIRRTWQHDFSYHIVVCSRQIRHKSRNPWNSGTASGHCGIALTIRYGRKLKATQEWRGIELWTCLNVVT